MRPNSSIWPIDRTISGTIIPGQSGPGSDSIEVVLCIPQSSNITGASPSDCLVFYLGHSLLGMQSAPSSAPADWVRFFLLSHIQGDVGAWFIIRKLFSNEKNKKILNVL